MAKAPHAAFVCLPQPESVGRVVDHQLAPAALKSNGLFMSEGRRRTVPMTFNSVIRATSSGAETEERRLF